MSESELRIVVLLCIAAGVGALYYYTRESPELRNLITRIMSDHPGMARSTAEALARDYLATGATNRAGVPAVRPTATSDAIVTNNLTARPAGAGANYSPVLPFVFIAPIKPRAAN